MLFAPLPLCVKIRFMNSQFHDTTQEQINTALEAAESAFNIYRNVTSENRAAFLEQISEELNKISDKLIDCANKETALGKERLKGELARTVNQLRLFADIARKDSWVNARIDTAIPDRTPLPKPDIRTMNIPIGPVVIFTASNFPLALSVAGSDTASALAVGCSVVVKVHPAHPETSELTANAIKNAIEVTGMPPGVFTLIHGAGYEVGTQLVSHPLTRAVAFTGSLRGGRALFDVAAKRPNPIPVYAEMGSVNPVFVLPGALHERGDAIAEGMRQSITLGTGQFCTNPGLTIGLNTGEMETFSNKLGELIFDSPTASMLYPGILNSYEAGIKRLSEIPGIKKTQSNHTADLAKNEARPTMFATDSETFFQHQDELHEEVFGPSTVLIACESKDEMEAIANSMVGNLTATIHANDDDVEQYQALIQILQNKVGRIVFNGFPTGLEVCPSLHHGGPYPAMTDPHFTSIGTMAYERFVRPMCYQGFPQSALPVELQNENKKQLFRLVNNQLSKEKI